MMQINAYLPNSYFQFKKIIIKIIPIILYSYYNINSFFFKYIDTLNLSQMNKAEKANYL